MTEWLSITTLAGRVLDNISGSVLYRLGDGERVSALPKSEFPNKKGGVAMAPTSGAAVKN